MLDLAGGKIRRVSDAAVRNNSLLMKNMGAVFSMTAMVGNKCIATTIKQIMSSHVFHPCLRSVQFPTPNFNLKNIPT